MTRQPDPPFPPRLLRAEAAAYYVGLGRTKFLELVDAGTIAQPSDEDPPRWKREDLDDYADSLHRRGETVTTSPRAREVRAL